MAAPDDETRLEQVENYEFAIHFGSASWPPMTVDEPPPRGKGAAPSPPQALCVAVGHCMSWTLLYTLQRARVPVQPFSTRVRATIGRNERGRLRVLSIALEIRTAPIDEADRERFDTCVKTFEEFCTVSGAIREG